MFMNDNSYNYNYPNANTMGYATPTGQAFVVTQPTTEQHLAAVQQQQILYANGYNTSLLAENYQLKSRLESTLMQLGKLRAEKYDNPSRFDIVNKYWTHTNGKGKRTPVAYVVIDNVKYINIKKDGTFDCLYAVYIAEDEIKRTAKVPFKDFSRRKFIQCFSGITMHIDCTSTIINELLDKLIRECPNNAILIIPEHIGWKTNKDTAVYIKGDIFESEVFKDSIPDCIKNNRLKPTKESADNIIKKVQELLPDSIAVFILFAFRIAGLFSSIYKILGLEWQQILVVEGTHPKTAEAAICLLKTFNRPSMNTLALDSSKTKVLSELSTIRDGTVILRDVSITDNEKKRADILNLLTSEITHTNPDSVICEHNLAVISNAASYLLPAEHYFSVSIDGSLFNKAPEIYQTAFEEIDAFLIKIFENNYKELIEKLEKHISSIHEIGNSLHSSTSVNTFLMLSSSVYLLNIIGFGLNMDVINEALIKILNTNSSDSGNNKAIVNEFAIVLNDAIRNEELNLVDHNSTIATINNNAIIWNNYICLEPDTIENHILPKLTVTKNLIRLCKALNDTQLLYCTKKNIHPIRIYTENGLSNCINTYSISCDILDKDNVDRIENLHNKDSFCSKSDISDSYFMPLIVNSNGKLAGILENLSDKNNRHIYVTGNSGQGKSILLAQMLYNASQLNHKIVVFDTNDSFTPAELSKSLPDDFIKNNITYHNVENDGIPIDLFNSRDCFKESQRKKILAGILSAPFNELSESQHNVIKKVLSDIMTLVDKSERLFPEDILEFFDEDTPTHKSIHNRLAPVFDDIKDSGMSEDTWGEFIEKSKDVIIITMNNCASESGNQLVDMMLATLFNYQTANSDCQLDIIIDEIQNQNMSETSPIMKIMKEGRKYLISFIGATQSFSKKGDGVGRVMKYAATNIFLKPTIDSEKNVADMLGFSKHEITKFRTMKPGDCYIEGYIYNNESKRNEPATIKGTVYLPFGIKN